MRFGDVLICHTGKDGGPESKVDGFWIFRHKKWFTIAFLRFNEGSREAFHNHAFNSISWLLSGGLVECVRRVGKTFDKTIIYRPSVKPIKTPRERMHMVHGVEASNWVFTIRGPWNDTWQEVVDGKSVTLTHNRVPVSNESGL